ncbi:7-cyano-7-deazaguanine synthase [Mycobacterium sp. Aquia_213]|uniref:7-cyano-7-deazaguanine synthase n=1 Tax=Mycobacterium sp. Aquia_213 TaxID=2991728 RepID=UPI00226F3A2D|nr:7-cyano-7-deazaguanine synthase [Mycobacterium sp. Aquia_213]WAC92227.1 7-cyano-7-deazaguanine synthase [Mycobacterium sp. Aquia_213]
MNPPVHSGRSLLLLSGGHDSIALAAWLRPEGCLTIHYGQRPVEGEMRASKAAADSLGLPWHTLRVDLTPVGSGLLHDDGATGSAAMAKRAEQAEVAPSPEWWPYRNQLLVSLAAAWALPRGYEELLVGSVGPDGARHRDGTAGFYERLNEVLVYQEGCLRVTAPAVGMTTVELIEVSGVDDSVLGYAHSCHTAAYPCDMCPGCRKHHDVISGSGRFQ